MDDADAEGGRWGKVANLVKTKWQEQKGKGRETDLARDQARTYYRRRWVLNQGLCLPLRRKGRGQKVGTTLKGRSKKPTFPGSSVRKTRANGIITTGIASI